MLIFLESKKKPKIVIDEDEESDFYDDDDDETDVPMSKSKAKMLIELMKNEGKPGWFEKVWNINRRKCFC